jgi:hypothetical protein
VAGELLIRLLDHSTFEVSRSHGLKPAAAAREAFLDHGCWSLTERVGPGWVIIESSAFYVEVPELYEDHNDMQVLLEDEETATLIVSRVVVARWKTLLDRLPAAGRVSTEQAEILAALAQMIEKVLRDPKLRLTVESIL